MDATRANHFPTRLLLTLVVVLLVAKTLPSLSQGFARDDFYLVTEFGLPDLTAERLFSPHPDGNPRPVMTLAFHVEYGLFGLNTWGYRLVSLALLALTFALLYRVVLRLGYPRQVALAALAILTAVSTYWEAWAWIAAQSTALCFVAYATAWLAALRFLSSSAPYWAGISLVALLLAMAAKADAVSFPAVLVLSWLILKRHDLSVDGRRVGALAVLSSLLIAVYLLLLRGPNDSQYGTLPTVAQVAQGAIGYGAYFPLPFTFMIDSNALRLLVSAAFALIIIWILARIPASRLPLLGFGLALAPYGLTYWQFVNPRYTLFPAFWLALAVATLATPRWARVALVGWLALQVAFAIVVTTDWAYWRRYSDEPRAYAETVLATVTWSCEPLSWMVNWPATDILRWQTRFVAAYAGTLNPPVSVQNCTIDA